MNKPQYYLSKIVFCGSEGAGKTALISRLDDSKWKFVDCEKTIGVDFKSILLRDKSPANKLQIWDTAGDSKFHAITRSYTKGSMVACLVWYPNIITWYEDLQFFYNHIKNEAPNISIIFVRSKADVEVPNKILELQYQKIRELTGGEFQLAVTSAKTGNGVNELKELLDKITYAKHDVPQGYQMNEDAFTVPTIPKQKSSWCWCCHFSRSGNAKTETTVLASDANDFNL